MTGIQLTNSSVERRLVYGCGFPHFRSVDGKINVQHIIPSTQTGIYVLAHKDGTYYVGKSINLGKRFEDHVVNKRPIVSYTFRKIHKSNLDKVETETIRLLEDMGVKLTNSEKMQSETVDGMATGKILQKDLTRWLMNSTWNDLTGNAPEARRLHSDNEEKYRNEFLHKPYDQKVIDFYAEYVKKCIFKPFQTAPDKWNVSCLPSKKYDIGKERGDAVSVLNVGGQGIVVVADIQGNIKIILAVRKSVFRKVHNNIERLRLLAPSVIEYKSYMRKLGDDQLDIIVPLDEAKAILKDMGLVKAIRTLVVHNNGMNQSGSSIYWSSHCYSFAKEILSRCR